MPLAGAAVRFCGVEGTVIPGGVAVAVFVGVGVFVGVLVGVFVGVGVGPPRPEPFGNSTRE